MKLDHFNAYLSGGAAVASTKLHEGLVSRGVDSRYWYSDAQDRAGATISTKGYHQLNWGRQDPPGILRLTPFTFRRFRERLLRSYYRWGKAKRFCMYSGPLRNHPTPCDARDLVHLHWVSRLVDYPSFFESIPKTTPIIWTLHDMQPITGGCHHAANCDHFQRQCGQCPVLGQPRQQDLSFRDHGIKKAALSGRQLHVVTPSKWLEKLARQSSILPSGTTFRTIRNGIDTRVFYPANRGESRRYLGLPENDILIGYGAESLSNRPKGIIEFLEAISRLPKHLNVSGVVFGRQEPPTGVATVPIHHLGFLSRPEQLRAAYSAVNVFTVPSHAETISQSAPESLSCGTPVVGSNIGGIPEVVRDGITGLLFHPQDSIDFSRKLQTLLETPELLARMSSAGHDLIKREFTLPYSIDRYLDLYQEILTAK
ncbi:MAG: glycosyltransferase [Rubripirellula sp.]